MAKKYNFFISYNNNEADIALAKKIVYIAKNAHLESWMQEKDSKAEFAKEIVTAIRSSEAFIVILSPSSAKSEWVGREIMHALRCNANGNLKILPIVNGDLNGEDAKYFRLILGDFYWITYNKTEMDDYKLRDEIFQRLDLSESAPDYSIYSAEDEREERRLKLQNELYSAYANPHLDEIFATFKAPAAVLDIGSSDGENILQRLKGRNYSKLLCVDKDEMKINAAIKKNETLGDAGKKNDFLAHDVTQRKFYTVLSDYLNENGMTGFDLIHFSSALMHMTNAKYVLKKLKGFLNDGGYIFIQDEDDGYNAAFEEGEETKEFFDDCFYIWKYSLESGDRNFGRKIPLFLKSAGYKKIDMKNAVVSSLDFGGKYKKNLWDLYFNYEHWTTDDPKYFSRQDAFNKIEDYIERYKITEKKYMSGKIFITLGVVIFVAQK